MSLPSERASFCKPCFSSCRVAEDSRAANTQNYCLCMAKDGGDFIATWAFYIHEIGIGALHQALLVFPLLFWRGMKKILCERHVLMRRSSPPERARCCYQKKGKGKESKNKQKKSRFPPHSDSKYIFILRPF